MKRTMLAFTLFLLGCPQLPEPVVTQVRFVADPIPQGAAVSLQMRALDAEKFQVDVMAHGAQQLYGVAFRLEYDADALTFVSLSDGPATARAKEERPGVLVLALGDRGPAVGPGPEERPLGTLTFRRGATSATALRIPAQHRGALTIEGEWIEVSWAAGTLAQVE